MLLHLSSGKRRDNMTINYKDLFNNKLKERVEINSSVRKKAEKVRADLEELDKILKDIVKDIEGVESEYIKEDDEVLVGDSETIKVKLHADESMKLVVSKKSVSFSDSNTADNTVHVNDETLEEYVIDTVDDEVVFDAGANNQEKEQVFEFVIEAVAEMIAEG